MSIASARRDVTLWLQHLSLIHISFAKRLHLKLTRSNIPITGISNTACCATDIVSMRIMSRYQRHSFEAKFAVLSSLTHNLPSISFDINQFHIPNKIFLADPDFNISSQIDILLGAQFYLDLILTNKYTRGPNFPIIQEMCIRDSVHTLLL